MSVEHTSKGHGDGSWRPLGLAVLITLLVAFPIRLYVALQAEMVSRDGIRFIWFAQGLARDALGEIRTQAQHPLYPAMVLAAHHAWQGLGVVLPGVPDDPVRSWPLAAVSVTLLGGLAVVLAVYALTAELFDRRVAVMAALLTALAAELCQLSADALTDMPHLAVYLFALAAGLRGLHHRRYRWLVTAGGLGGMGFLLRPEAAEVVIVVAAGILLWSGGWRWRQRLAGLLCLSLPAAAFACPYMAVTGKLVQKKSPARLISGEVRLPAHTPLITSNRDSTPRTLAALSPVRIGQALTMIAAEWARSLRVTYLLPLAFWVFMEVRRRRERAERGADPGHGTSRRPADMCSAGEKRNTRVIALAAGLHLGILIGLIINFDYWKLFSMRHVLILTGLTLPYIAAGTVQMLEQVPGPRRGWAGAGLIALLVLPTAPWMFERLHAEVACIRRAGEWIRSRQPHPPPRIMSTRHNAAFYANGVEVWCPIDENLEAVVAAARQARPDWLVFDEVRARRADPDYFRKLEAAALPGERFALATITESDARYGGRRAFVYRYQPPP